jgi:hypothetical protein
MKRISEQSAGRAKRAPGWLSRVKKSTMVLGEILILALLFNPSCAQSATLPDSYSAALAWTRSPNPEVTGYFVYYGTASGQYSNSVDVGNVTTTAVSGLTGGITYFFSISCYDATGLQSPVSTGISYVPGLPIVGFRATADGPAVLAVDGLIGQSYDIQAAQTLPNWVIIGTVTLGASGSVNFTDTNAVKYPTRFYRTRQIH